MKTMALAALIRDFRADTDRIRACGRGLLALAERAKKSPSGDPERDRKEIIALYECGQELVWLAAMMERK